MRKKTTTKLIAFMAISTLMVSFCVTPVPVANAAALTDKSDTMSSLKIDTLSSHIIKFTTPTGANESTDTIIITFPADFDFTSKAISTVSFTHGDTTGEENTETLATSPSETVWGAVFSDTENRVLTLTAPTDGIGAAAVATSDKVIITYDSTNSTNPSTTGSKTIAISGTFGDTGDILVQIITDDVVAVAGTVDESLTFAITDVAIGFGIITSSNGRFATGDEAGQDDTPVAAHNLTVATNATSGYTITYNGATLTSGSDMIDVATVTDDADGTPGSEQFAIGFANGGGDATVVTTYDQELDNYNFVASTTTSIISETVPTATETIGAYYLANIAGNTDAGSYTTAITYVATANF